MELKEKQPRQSGIFTAVIIVAAVCLVFAIMQGVHDNYGIMLNGVMGVTGLDYAFASAFLGGLFVKNGLGYAPLWIVNLCLAALAAAASYAIREEKA